MRGWTVARACKEQHAKVFPAHAGMDRRASTSKPARKGVPRACGDGPVTVLPGCSSVGCSPRMRGWTVLARHHRDLQGVFPAHAGMDRGHGGRRDPAERVPRACGDGPTGLTAAMLDLACSPRMRGWTGTQSLEQRLHPVFPAHAGMDRLCLGFALVCEVRAECGTPTGRSARKHG